MIDRFCFWLAWRLPRRLCYFASIRLVAHATMGPWDRQVVPELTAMDALDRWQLPAA
jgi:hypothetical protein